MNEAASNWAYVGAALITVVVPAMVTLYLSSRSHRVLTKNHHSSKKPTIPDRLDNLEKLMLESNQLLLKHILDHENEKKVK
jgi:hypothetical protein